MTSKQNESALEMAKDSTDNMLTIPSGSIINFTEGEHSDYFIIGTFRSLQELSTAELRKLYLAKHPDERKSYVFDNIKFILWLTAQGYIKPIHSWEWHSSGYTDRDDT